MTVIELFKNKSIDEIVEVFANLRYTLDENGIMYQDENNVSRLFGDDISDSDECPDNCEYYEDGYYDTGYEGMCYLDDCGINTCPYKVNRKEVWKKNLIKWLNKTV